MNDFASHLSQYNRHLLWRAGFGPSAAGPEKLLHESPHKLFRRLLKESEKPPEHFDVASPVIKEMFSGEEAMKRPDGATAGINPPSGDADRRREMRKQSAVDIRILTLKWLDEMTSSPAQLREKMSLFWHGHFASRTGNIIYDQQLLQIIRENALGHFSDLLRLAAKSASQIQFLNTNQNRKNHPNENFARELMELFTLGRGNYTETDVKEAARAFTGWGTDAAGNFQFRERQHDSANKTFLGRTGNWTGDDILNIILGQRQCAIFITGKIYRFFVNESAPADRITVLANRFYESDYNLTSLLTGIFTSDWFYDPENMGNRIKSPVEWMVGMRRQLPMQWEDPQVQLLTQRLLGQVLFNPPNVAGWPGGRHWIDSSTLMLRLRFPAMMDQDRPVGLRPKSDDDTEMGMKPAKGGAKQVPFHQKGQVMRSHINWDGYAKRFGDLKERALFAAISEWLIQASPAPSFENAGSFSGAEAGSALIRALSLRLMATPEYQLC